MAGLLAFLQGLLPLLGPELVQLWESELKPVLAAKIASMGPDEQVSANALLAALDSIIQVEAPKI